MMLKVAYTHTHTHTKYIEQKLDFGFRMLHLEVGLKFIWLHLGEQTCVFEPWNAVTKNIWFIVTMLLIISVCVYCTFPSNCLSKDRMVGVLEAIPTLMRWEAAYTLHSLPVHHRANIVTLNSEWLVKLTGMSLHCGRKLRHQHFCCYHLFVFIAYRYMSCNVYFHQMHALKIK